MQNKNEKKEEISKKRNNKKEQATVTFIMKCENVQREFLLRIPIIIPLLDEMPWLKFLD